MEITGAAVHWLEENRTRNRVPASFGVRVFAGSAAGRIAVRSVAEPRANEETVVREGLRFFVSPEVTDLLESRIIDVRDGSSSLVLVRRSRTGSPDDPAGTAGVADAVRP